MATRRPLPKPLQVAVFRRDGWLCCWCKRPVIFAPVMNFWRWSSGRRALTHLCPIIMLIGRETDLRSWTCLERLSTTLKPSRSAAPTASRTSRLRATSAMGARVPRPFESGKSVQENGRFKENTENRNTGMDYRLSFCCLRKGAQKQSLRRRGRGLKRSNVNSLMNARAGPHPGPPPWPRGREGPAQREGGGRHDSRR